jgi:hypothetical protein
MSMTQGIPRTAVGLTAPGLTLTSSNATVADATYDPHAQHDLQPVVVHAKGPGQAMIAAERQGIAVASLNVEVFPVRKVRLTVKNVVSADGRFKGYLAKKVGFLAAGLDKLFVSQGGLTFHVAVGKDVTLPTYSLFESLGGKVLQVDASKGDQVQTVLKGHVDSATDFTIFFCWALHGSPCAAGLTVKSIVLVDETHTGGGDRQELIDKIVAHELVHAMGHTKEKFGEAHAKSRDNLMYYSTDSGDQLTRRQIEYISRPKNWYKLE